MTKAAAIELAASLKASEGFEAKVVEMFKGKRSIEFNVQFRKVGDVSTHVDGKYSFVVVK